MSDVQTSAGSQVLFTEAMTPDEAIRHMDEIIARSVNEFGEVMMIAAETAKTLIVDRVTQQGIDAEGNPFPPYSTKPMLTNCSSTTKAVCNTLAGTKKKRSQLKWVTIKKGDKNVRLFELPGGYKEFREIHGHRTDITNFFFSGRMMSDIAVVSSDDEHTKGRAVISTKHDEQNLKLQGNTDRKGEILMLSDSEVKEVSDIIEDWLISKWYE